MEFDFPVNDVLPDTVTKITSSHLSGIRRQRIITIIDELGLASAKAQELQVPVTVGNKFLLSDQVIYLLKETKAKKSACVGLLKTGRKKLFVLDTYGNQNEMFPLCILDFYIHETRQRQGYGKQLFDFMLSDENISPNFLAVDRPSAKFLEFLGKHYNLHSEIPQVNNFTVFEGFFKDNESFVVSPSLRSRNSSEICLSSVPQYRRSWEAVAQNEGMPDRRISLLSDGSSKPAHTAQNIVTPRQCPSATDHLSWYTHIPMAADAVQDSAAALTNKTAPAISGEVLGQRTPSSSPVSVSSSKSSVLDDSGMKIFGVPSTWRQPDKNVIARKESITK